MVQQALVKWPTGWHLCAGTLCAQAETARQQGQQAAQPCMEAGLSHHQCAAFQVAGCLQVQMPGCRNSTAGALVGRLTYCPGGSNRTPCCRAQFGPLQNAAGRCQQSCRAHQSLCNAVRAQELQRRRSWVAAAIVPLPGCALLLRGNNLAVCVPAASGEVHGVGDTSRAGTLQAH